MRHVIFGGIITNRVLAFFLISYALFFYTGDKGDLVPPAPGLTRYKKEVAQKIVSKKKVADPRLPDERRSSEINLLSTTTLCVRLNTLHVSAASHRVPKIKVKYEILNCSYVR